MHPTMTEESSSDTLCLTDDGTTEMEVGHFAKPAFAEQQQQRPFVFICHCGRDNSKELFARPVYWLLTQSLGISAFLDDWSIGFGEHKEDAMARALYECNSALVILSPSFRSRQFCVKELNTLMHRQKVDDGVKILPVLWQMDNVKDYNPALANLIYAVGKTSNPVYFLLDTLWPKLIQALGLETRSRKMIEQLLTYISIQSGSGGGVPADFIRFVNDHGITLTLPSSDARTKTNAELWCSSSQTEADQAKEDKFERIVGLTFSTVFKYKDKEWNQNILARKSHIEENLKRVARFGRVIYGRGEIRTKRVGMFGFGAAVVRLEIEIELDDDLSPGAFATVRDSFGAIARLLRDSGATEEELGSILIGSAWKGCD